MKRRFGDQPEARMSKIIQLPMRERRPVGESGREARSEPVRNVVLFPITAPAAVSRAFGEKQLRVGTARTETDQTRKPSRPR